ncbi:MAG: SCP2 sterol-binding domain-containing protein [Pseudohongiella sp.]|nr:SCP2 sterol-binding domain-containing protein [Pseudohongiella sp.]MDO9521916.1 SCP2 sterol-binding domain-containing protein [Pseudohongiella sp.]MDP2128551.1 SCP2 sterol-binding domain-containing protein [Pseudohongiella sp.]
MSNLLVTGLVQLLENGINTVLRQDPHLLRSLDDIGSGKSIRLICTSEDPETESWRLTLIITPEKLHLQSNNQDDADATICGSKKALAGLLASDDPAGALHHPELDLRGDVHLIQRLHKVMSTADTRWDDVLAPLLKPFIGDTGTAIGTTAINGSIGFMQNTARSMKLNIKDFLQEESGLLPTRSEVGIANERLDTLRLRLDRLSARAEQLRQRVTN